MLAFTRQRTLLEKFSLRTLIRLSRYFRSPSISGEGSEMSMYLANCLKELQDANLGAADIDKFLENGLTKLKDANVLLPKQKSKTEDIISHTIALQQSEIDFCLDDGEIGEREKNSLRAIRDLTSFTQIMDADGSLNFINMVRVSVSSRDALNQNASIFILDCKKLTRIPYGLLQQLQEFPNLKHLILEVSGNLKTCPDFYSYFPTLKTFSISCKEGLHKNYLEVDLPAIEPLLGYSYIPAPQPEFFPQVMSSLSLSGPSAAKPIIHAFEHKKESQNIQITELPMKDKGAKAKEKSIVRCHRKPN